MVAVQVAGRALRAAAILLAVYGFGYNGISVSVIWMSIASGVFGIVLQWILIPLSVYRVENLKKNEN